MTSFRQSTGHDTALMIPGRKDRRRWLALGAVCVGMLMIAVDATVVNVALPIIQ
jgi:hypothetical protein